MTTTNGNGTGRILTVLSITLSIVLFLLVQIGGAAYLAGEFNGRIAGVELRLSRVEEDVRALRAERRVEVRPSAEVARLLDDERSR